MGYQRHSLYRYAVLQPINEQSPPKCVHFCAGRRVVARMNNRRIGELIEAGQCAALLTASAPDTENMWYLIGTANAQQLESSKASAMSLRCVKAE